MPGKARRKLGEPGGGRLYAAARKGIQVYAYSNAASLWLNAIEVMVSTVVGVRTGIMDGLLVMLAFRAARAVVGWLDLEKAGATAYYNEFLSRRAPSYSRILKKR